MIRKALVIDNDFFFVAFLSELLEKRGFETIKAYDGKAGIEKLRQGPVDILFVDMVMTGIDGRDLIKFARSRFPEGEFPVVAVSGSLIEQLDNLDTLGADYYIAKGPMDVMAEHIDRFLARLANPLAEPGDRQETVIKPDALYPRPETKDLIDALEFYRSIIDEIGMGILVVDKDGKIVKVNSEALKILNKSYECVLNCRVTDLVPPGKGRNRLISSLKTAVRHPERKKNDLTFLAGEDVVRGAVSLLKAQKKTIGWVIALADVSGGDAYP